MSASDTPSSPPPRRRRRFHWTHRLVLGLVLLSLLIVVAAVVVWTTQGDHVASRTAAYLNRSLFDADSTRIRLGRVSGFPFTGLTVERAVLERRTSQGWFDFVAVPRLEVDYDLWSLVNGRYRISRVQARDLRLELRDSGGGAYYLPRMRRGGGGGGASFGIDRLTITGGSFRIDLPDFTARLTDLAGELEFTLADGGVELDLLGVGGVLNDSLGVFRVEAGEMVARDGVRFDRVRGRWGSARFSASGTPSGLKGGGRALDLEVEELPLEPLGILLGRTDYGPGFVELAQAHLEDRDDELFFHVEGSGRWAEWNADGARADGRLTDTDLMIDRASADVRGARFEDLQLRMPREGRTLELEATFQGLRSDSLAMFAWSEFVPGVYAGRGRLEFQDRGDPGRGMRVQLDLGESHVHQVPFREARISMHGGDAGWEIDDLEVLLAAARLEGAGTFSETQVAVQFDYEGDLRPLRGLTRTEDLSGSGHMVGSLTGLVDEVVLVAEGSITDLRVGPFAIPRVLVQRGGGPINRGRHLELEFIAPDPFALGGVPVSSARGELIVEETRAWMNDLTLERGDSVLTLSGSMEWEPVIRVEMERAEVTLGERRFEIPDTAVVVIDAGTFSTPGLTLLTPRGTLSGEGSFNPGTGYVDARLRALGLDPFVFLPADVELPFRVESLEGVVELKGNIPILDGRADISMVEVSAGRTELDSLAATLTVTDRRVVIDRLRARRGSGLFEASGSVVMPAPLYTVLEAEVFGPDLSPDSTLWNVEARAEDVRLGDWLTFLRRDRRPQGRIDARLTLGGSSAAPRVGLDLRARALVWRNFLADSLVFSGSTAGGVLDVRTLDLWQHGIPVHVEGTAPVDLTFKPLVHQFGEGPLDLAVESRGGSLENLQITPWVDEARGSIDGSARVLGTVREPLVEGEVRVRDGVVRPRDRDEVLEGVNAWILFDRDLVKVTAAEAYLGGGVVTARGTYRLHTSETETYELLVNARDAVVYEKARYAARVNGNLRLIPMRGEDGRIYPFAEGDITATRAEYIGALQAQDIARFTPHPILYDVTVAAPSRVFVVSGDVDVELAADLRVRQEPNRRIVLGNAQILRGTYRLFLRKFRITDGELTWSDPNVLLPEMDVTAETTDRDALIVVRWTGRADEPVIEFSARSLETGEDLGLSDEEVIQRLAIGSFGLTSLGLFAEEGSSGNESSIDASLQAMAIGASLFVREVERALLRRVGIFDDVNINPEYDGDSPDFRIEVRKWFTPELSLRYEQGISRYFDQDLALEYRLRRSLFLRGESLRRRDEEAGITQEYNLDLKIRHEY